LEAARVGLSAGSSFSLRRFVPGHPIAGRELPGVEFADAQLFSRKLVITTRNAETSDESGGPGRVAVQRAGARVYGWMQPNTNRIFAPVSHLPHLLAFAWSHRLPRNPMAIASWNSRRGIS